VGYSGPVRVRLRYVTLDVFVERFAPNVTRGGLFLASRSPRAVGDIFPFEVQLATGEIALAGEGKVIWTKEFDPAQPAKPHGMGVQFVQLSAESRLIVARLLKAKAAPGATARGATQPLSTTGGPDPRRARVDTGVDLAAEFGLDETVLRRALERTWSSSARPVEEDLDHLLRPEAAETFTLAQALNDLPRLLQDPSTRRRTATGAVRVLEPSGVVAAAVTGEHTIETASRETASRETGSREAVPRETSSENGVTASHATPTHDD
jgi:uncharacterized protein (TIGR02266 family)